MKRLFLVAGFGACLSAGRVEAQTSLDAIMDDLRAAQLQHDQSTSQAMLKFNTALDAASQSGAQALSLYNDAGGSLPDLTPVRKHYDYETPTEKEAREARDAQNYAAAAVVIQVHCGLMKYAAMLSIKPPPPGAQEQFLAWLNTAAALYPQLGGERALKNVSMRDSVISNYLGFHGWGDSPQSNWKVRDLPELYRTLVLEPLRHPPGPGTLDSWDAYTNMVQADTDREDWAGVEPSLDFDRAADDFAIEPSMDKLTTLDTIIKANPASDHLSDWISRMKAMIGVYRSGGSAHSPLPGPTAGSPSSEVNSVTTVATSGTPSSGTTSPTPAATGGSPGAGTYAPTPSATAGTPSSGTSIPTPGATAGTPGTGGLAPTPSATQGTPASGTAAPTPTATPGTPSSGAPAPTPAATPGTPTTGVNAPTSNGG